MSIFSAQRRTGLFQENGGYLLSHLAGSTIGAGGLNFSVRDGKRWNPATIATLMFHGTLRVFVFRAFVSHVSFASHVCTFRVFRVFRVFHTFRVRCPV